MGAISAICSRIGPVSCIDVPDESIERREAAVAKVVVHLGEGGGRGQGDGRGHDQSPWS